METAKNLTSPQLADLILEILNELQAIDPVRIDIRKTSAIADFYLLAGANSIPHLKALANEVGDRLKQGGLRCHAADTDAESGWIVLDYLDVVLHLMLTEQRLYYALEDLWRETAPAIVKMRQLAVRQDTPESHPPEPPKARSLMDQAQRRQAPD